MSYVDKVKRIPIKSMEMLQDVVGGMAKAEIRPIHVQGVGDFNEFAEYQELVQEEEFWDSKKFAVVNTRSNQLAQIVSPSYKILDHSMFFASVCDKLEAAGVRESFEGYILEFNDGNAYTARFIFKDVEIEEPYKGRNIKVGAEFSNSYDSAYAAKGRAFFLRVSCTNQMVLQNVIPECIFSRSHVAPTEIKLLEMVEDKLDTFMYELQNSGAVFTSVMNDAIESEIEYASPLQLEAAFEKIIGIKKRADEIAEMAHRNAEFINGKYHLTRWDAYNSVTDYASHTAMPPSIFDQILVKAEKGILSEEMKIPLEVPIRE